MSLIRFVLLALACLVSTLVEARELPLPDEVIVRYRSGSAFAAADTVDRWLDHRTAVLRVDARDRAAKRGKGETLNQLMGRLRKRSDVLYVEPNHRGYFEDLPAASLPDDPQLSSQWWLDNVNARLQWSVTKGAGVVVAVVDSGADFSHPDIAPNLLSSGYNFGDANAVPQDQLGHGTAVSGVIAAIQNNALGVSGLAPAVRILPVKINVGGEGTFLSDRLALAIRYAADQGARVINLSLVVTEQTQTVGEAVQYALDKGVILVVAAGNSGGSVAFPATMPGVIAVAATTRDGNLWSGSNRGPEIAIAAPGESIFSTDVGGGYRNRTGTSLAAPVVSAAVAAQVAVRPSFSRDQIREHLRAASKPLTTPIGDFGVLDAGESVLSLLPRLYSNADEIGPGSACRCDAELRYVLPVSTSEADIYVAVETPFGEFSLHPDGSWSAATAGYVPIALNYFSASRQVGVLFGREGAFPPVALSGAPAGEYVWKVAMVERSSGRIVGAINTTSIRVKP